MIISGFTDEISNDFETQLNSAIRLGMSHISLRNIDGWNVGDCPEEVFETRVLPLCSQYGIGVSSIGSPLGKVALDDEAGYSDQLETAKKLLNFAQRLNCHYIRIFSFYLPQDRTAAECHEVVIARIRGFLDVFRGSGITLLHENEKGIYGDTAERCLELVKDLAGEDFGIIFDPANFVQCHVDPMEAFSLLESYVQYVHIKDADAHSGVNVVCGSGQGRIPQILAQLKKRGYNGFLTLEPHLVVFDGLAGLEQGDHAEDVIDTSRSMTPFDAFALQHSTLQDLLKKN